MTIRCQLPRMLARSVACLTIMGIIGCGGSSDPSNFDFGDGSNPCTVGRPAAMTITGAPTAMATGASCGSALFIENGTLVSISLVDGKTYDPVANFVVGITTGTTSVGAPGTIKGQVYYGVANQSGYCKNPGGTIAVFALNASPIADQGTAQGSFSDVRLCSANGTLVYTVSGTFHIP